MAVFTCPVINVVLKAAGSRGIHSSGNMKIGWIGRVEALPLETGCLLEVATISTHALAAQVITKSYISEAPVASFQVISCFFPLHHSRMCGHLLFGFLGTGKFLVASDHTS
jgi:hypothetical protein